ncbi:MAG: thioesterase family protein [Bacteroidota bacterium]|nr:thioesterase family protein [Bacteroidota bacterium]
MEPVEVLTRRTSLRVRYADTDQMQIVYNGKYFEYFEVGRTELLRSVGLPYARLEEGGFRLPLVEAHCEFLSPARYDDILVIETTVRDYTRARLRIDYIVTKEQDGRTIARGYTVHAFQRIADGRVTRPPKIFFDTLRNAQLDPQKP